MACFLSDNTAPAHPRVIEAMGKALSTEGLAYGQDRESLRCQELFRDRLGESARAYAVSTGSAANVLGLKSLVDRHEAVVCAASAHINQDECAAPEAVGGFKLIPLRHEDGRIAPVDLPPLLAAKGFVHHAQPKVVSITQCTEYGALYPMETIRAIADFAHSNDMLLHMDGARLANACAALNCSLKSMTTDLGVDALSFGGTKNGCAMAEAVVFLREGVGETFPYLRKQTLQLNSKMRLISAQFCAYFEDDLWLACAQQANNAAVRLAELAGNVPGVEITRPVETNAVFARPPAGAVEPLQARYPFYMWDEGAGEARWMCSWSTSNEDIESFVRALEEASNAS
ncbi:MAG: threonine aldolase [Desulfovibrionales bacterium]|jgi:threonine aldolase|nr:threonine aldolase [Desulfovibrionales bacterium]